MNPLKFAAYEIVWYGLWWLPFVVIAYCSARYFGWWGLATGVILISALVIIVDVNWIFRDMREHPENGRDADFIFWFGVLCRIVIFNVVLLPVVIAGRILRNRQAKRQPNVS